jgi:hypothetical protein
VIEFFRRGDRWITSCDSLFWKSGQITVGAPAGLARGIANQNPPSFFNDDIFRLRSEPNPDAAISTRLVGLASREPRGLKNLKATTVVLPTRCAPTAFPFYMPTNPREKVIVNVAAAPAPPSPSHPGR